MTKPKKLIEVAMPIKEISAESVRDKSIRHGHISTLHLWWARRPLPVCRAVVFASLVPDPLDENCSKAFQEAVEILLGKKDNSIDPYKPYLDIPYTSAEDKMEDNLRNRLMMFIGKFSDIYSLNEKSGKKTASKDQISDFSLIKWDNKNNEDILNKARKLIWVAYNSLNEDEKQKSAKDLMSDFDNHYKAIKNAENRLYSIINRHIESKEIKEAESDLQKAIDSFLNKMPKVFDPFAGGGAIPLEAARLGCKTYANDLNPVAHIIEKGSLEFPQKYGKPITYSKDEFIKLYGEELWIKLPNENKIFDKDKSEKIEIENRLSFDVDFYSKKLLKLTEDEIGYLYSANSKGILPIVYYWSRIGTCSNPSCNAEIPLLKQFYLSKRRSTKEDKWIHLEPIINGNKVKFNIKNGKSNNEGWVLGRTLKCPCCNNSTSMDRIKEESKSKGLTEKMIAVIEARSDGKYFRNPTEKEIEMSGNIISLIDYSILPKEKMQDIPDLVSGRGWGITKWQEMFSDRQSVILQTLLIKLRIVKSELLNLHSVEYGKAIMCYIAFLIDRIGMRFTKFNTWHIQQDTVEKIMGRQAIPMVYDYPEMNPFSEYTSAAPNQLNQIINYINEESSFFNISNCKNSASGEKEQFDEKSIFAVITDPPYYNAIAYADLSDFFYVWLKKTLGDIYPNNFSTPLTPKTDECTALKYHHNNNYQKAKEHFESKLLKIFDVIEHQTSEIISIMFAHQSTEAWTTLCNSIIGARMNITGSWSFDTEATGGLKEGKSYLESSVTVSCVPIIRSGIGDFKELEKSIVKKVESEVKELFRLGFRGADLLTACFGKAMSEFGKYEKVEKSDGSEVTVEDLLKLARESAFKALLKGYEGDEYTKFYIGWLQLYGFSESDFDDAAKFSRVGLSINVDKLFAEKIFIKNGNKQTLATYSQRNKSKKNFGEENESNLIDRVHRAMYLYESGNRKQLLNYIAKFGSSAENSFWRVATSLDELLPKGSNDHKQVNGLIMSKENIIRDSKKVDIGEQVKLDL